MTQNRPLHPTLSPADAAASAKWLGHAGNHFLTPECPDYPLLLKELIDPPPFLFVTGNLSLLNRPMVALVGSRNATRQGCLDAEAFTHALSEAGVTVVSGLAVGVDEAAHRGALDGLGGTIAVLGTGMDRVYPSQHRELAHSIARMGTLVSEFPLGMAPQKWHFPKRNRIIAGLYIGLFGGERQPFQWLPHYRSRGPRGRARGICHPRLYPFSF
jgi:DNA processing protein